MNPETRQGLNVISKELNELLNALYESSKTTEKLTFRLLLRNTCILCWRKLRSVKGVIATLGVSVAGIVAVFTEAFVHFMGLPLSFIIVLSGTFLVLVASLVRMVVLHEMSTVGSDLFHLSVYEKRKRREFHALISLAKQRDFVFTLKKQVELELSADTERLMLKKELAEYIDMLEQKNQQLEAKNEAIEEKNEAIYTLLEAMDRSEETAVFYKEKSDLLLDILYQLKSGLNLFVNDQFHIDRIHLGVNYTLYRVTKKGLVFIGGYGVNRAEVDVFIPYTKRNNQYIQSMNYSQANPLQMTDFISWKRKLQDGSYWILSLHLEASNRDKLMGQTEMTRLNLTLTQEILWICCELFNKFSKKNQKD